MKKQYMFLILIANLAFLVIFCSVFIYFYTLKTQVYEIHETGTAYEFINPLLECRPGYDYYNPGRIKQDLNSYIKKSLASQEVLEVSYYVRLLKNGSTFWYNQNTKFIPASLVKLPLAISLIKQSSPAELQQEILITQTEKDSSQGDVDQTSIQAWKSYSLFFLLSEMLIHSDNTASNALLNYLNIKKTSQTYEHFWLWLVDLQTSQSLNMSVKDYASFFRVLYNSSYLTREDSETLLSLLSKSSFKSGIRSLLPPEINIANKFWVRSLETWEQHVHDCGNIYTWDTPYLLCVMTRWTNQAKQLQVIQNISKMVYDDIILK